MRILDLLNEPWAILPTKKQEIVSVYMTHLRGEKIDLKAIEARLGRPLGNQREFQVIDGKAIIPVEGVLSKRISLLHDVSGGTSTEKLSNTFDEAMADPSVKEIILHVDSPGGAVDGTKVFADKVFAARGVKPITAIADGLAASAAYWIGSAADKFYIKDVTTMVGSIGVVATHVDQSVADAAEGVKVTEITAGEFKRADSQHAPLSEQGQKMIQDRVDALYDVFVADVARNRGVSVETVISDMADGRVFIGMDAVERGLVDGVATMDMLLSRPVMNRPAFAAATVETPILEAQTMSESETAPVVDAVAPAVVEDLAGLERQRIQGVLAHSMPGLEDMVSALAFDGKTTPDQAAVLVLAETKKRMATQSASLAADAPAPVVASASEPTEDKSTGLRARWDRLPSAMKASYANFDAFVAANERVAEMASEGRIHHFSRTK